MVGWSLMKELILLENISMIANDMTMAIMMIARFSTRPTAVKIESNEKTTSSKTI